MAMVSASIALAIDMLLPAMGAMRPAFDLPDDSSRLSLTITLFFLGSGVGNLVYGPLSDALGRKPVLVISLSMYGIAAVVSALAPTLAVLFAARFVWGLAAAGPRTLTQAIVRDRYSGDAMARIMSLIQTAFFLGPVIAPIMGKAIVELTSWRWVLGFGAVIACVALLWSTRLEETLSDDHRRPLQFRSVLDGFKAVLANKVTLGYAVSVTFTFGAFFSYLSSSELIFSDVLNKPGWFVPSFSLMSAVMAMVALSISRILRVVPARNLALAGSIGFATVGALFLLVALITDGRPNPVVFIAIIVAATTCNVVGFPTTNSLALEPMGAVAGTASAVIGFISSAFGGILAQIINRAIDGTVTPMALGFAVYGLFGLGFQLYARSRSTSSRQPLASSR